MPCPCPAPSEAADPRHKGQCSKCGKPIAGPAESITEFYDNLGAALFPGWFKRGFKPPTDWLHYRAQAEARYYAGIEKFGMAYLARDNNAEGREEHADGGNYAWFDSCRHRRLSGDTVDPSFDLVLEEAADCFRAYKHNLVRAQRRRGNP